MSTPPHGASHAPTDVRESGFHPRLSVVVPAYRCADQLRIGLAALVASALPRSEWELIVVDDGSPDDTGATARPYADQVLRTGDTPRGPAFARNLGAQAARAELLLFVDADVVVRPDVLSRVVDHFAADPTLTAVFGSYDAMPAASGLVSQYRNLLHRYVHLAGAGAATTFWAGIGAVRHAAFNAVGGFDAARYPRPQIEDIDLGYRLHDAGGAIRLDPEISGSHLKRWTLKPMLRTDLLDRAVPWMRLLLERQAVLAEGPLNTSRGEQVMVAATALAMPLSIMAAVSGNAMWLVGALVCVGVVVIGNGRLFAWFASVRGVGFALATIPLRLLFYVVSVIGATWVMTTTLFSPRRDGSTAPATPREAPVR